MLIALILVIVLFFIQSSYLLIYRKQIRRISNQLVFIVQHDSLKLIDAQIRPQEVHELIEVSNKLLQDRRIIKQDFLTKNEAINDTITSLSHDIRTPLTSMDGYLQLAERSSDESVKADYIRLARTRIKQMSTLVDELFLYTKLQNPDYTLELSEVDAAELLRQSLLTSIEAINQTGYEPELKFPESMMVSGNELAVQRVFANILSNYVTHGAGQLSIQSEETIDSHRLVFRNKSRNGKSVQVEDIFTRFYKADHARTDQTSGLGLSIVQSLIEKMGGQVSAEMIDEQFSLSIQLKKQDVKGKEEHA